MPNLGPKMVVLRAGGYDAETQVFAPPTATLLTAGAAAEAVTAKFDVTFTGFTSQAQAAFQAAVNVWSVVLSSEITTRVDARFDPLDPNVLGQAGPEDFDRDFPGALQPNTWYPIALANKLSGADRTPGAPHIRAQFNSSFANWHFGTTGDTPVGQFDFMSVVLHELGHGLGFIGSMNVADGVGSWGFGTGRPLIYDRFAETGQGQKLLNTALFPNPSAALAGQLQSDFLFFDGPKARAANANNPVRIYAPIVFEPGSSYSHLNESTFPPGSSNSLMTPQIGRAEAIHQPGPIGRGLLRDLGW